MYLRVLLNENSVAKLNILKKLNIHNKLKKISNNELPLSFLTFFADLFIFMILVN